MAEATTAQSVRPKFVLGKVVVAGPNQAPEFAALSDQSILEGDSLKLRVVATDPDGNKTHTGAPVQTAGSDIYRFRQRRRSLQLDA